MMFTTLTIKELPTGSRVTYRYHDDKTVTGTIVEQNDTKSKARVRFDETPEWEIEYDVPFLVFFQKKKRKRCRLEKERWVSVQHLH